MLNMSLPRRIGSAHTPIQKPKEIEMRRGKLMKITITLIALFALSVTAHAQLPPAASLVPPGFKVELEKNLGSSIHIAAKKPNENFPKPHMDQGIDLEISWMNQPMADQVLEMVANQPQDPAGQIPGSATREEPCGKQRYQGGVLSCRKVITPWIGAGKGPDLMTWRIGWTGKGHGGLVGVSINNFYGAKETAMAWIDSIIPKITR